MQLKTKQIFSQNKYFPQVIPYNPGTLSIVAPGWDYFSKILTAFTANRKL